MDKLYDIWINHPTSTRLKHSIEFMMNNKFRVIDEIININKMGIWKLNTEIDNTINLDLIYDDCIKNVTITFENGKFVHNRNNVQHFDQIYKKKIVFDKDPFPGELHELQSYSLMNDTDENCWLDFYMDRVPDLSDIFDFEEHYCYICDKWISKNLITLSKNEIIDARNFKFITIMESCNKCRSLINRSKLTKWCIWCNKCGEIPEYSISRDEDDSVCSDDSNEYNPHKDNYDSSSSEESANDEINIKCKKCSSHVELKNLSSNISDKMFKCKCNTYPHFTYDKNIDGTYEAKCRKCKETL